MKRIQYFLMTTEKYSDRRENIMKTWGQNQDIIFYSDVEHKDKNIIKVTDKNDYWSLEEKHVNIFKFLENNYLDYEWFFFGDDDTFVNTKKLEELSQIGEKNSAYGCLINCYPKIKTLYYHSGGGGILMHRNVLDKLSKTIATKNTNFADVTLGICLREININMVNDDRFHSENNNTYGINLEQIKDNITFHHITNYYEMLKLHNSCQ